MEVGWKLVEGSEASMDGDRRHEALSARLCNDESISDYQRKQG